MLRIVTCQRRGVELGLQKESRRELNKCNASGPRSSETSASVRQMQLHASCNSLDKAMMINIIKALVMFYLLSVAVMQVQLTCSHELLQTCSVALRTFHVWGVKAQADTICHFDLS